MPPCPTHRCLFAPAQGSFAGRTWTVSCMLVVMMLTGCRDGQPLSPRTDASQLAGADTVRGRTLIAQYGCIACHTVPGVRGPSSNVGPPLEEFGLRAYVGGVLPNTPADLVRWLLDPPAVSPRTAMPNTGLSQAEARDIAAYLLTLR